MNKDNGVQWSIGGQINADKIFLLSEAIEMQL